MMGLMAVPGLSSECAGLIAFWRLSGPTPHYTFRNSWFSAGLDSCDLPANPSIEVAAGRAAKSMRGPGRLVRQYRQGDDEGWTVAFDAGEDERTISHSVECRVLLRGDYGIRIVPFDHRYAPDIMGAFDQALGEWSPGDISNWLVRLVERHDAVSLRDTGGFYFVPPQHVQRWRQAARVVNENTNHKVFEIPAVRSEEAIAAVADAVSAEAEAFAAKLEAELAEGKIGERAMENRRQASDAVLNKVRRYEDLLGSKLDTLRARVEKLQVEMAAGELSQMDFPLVVGVAP